MDRGDAEFQIVVDAERPPEIQFGQLCLVGRIVLGEFSERFILPIDYWGLADYYQQWRSALVAFCRGLSPVCLVTAMRAPTSSSFINTWVLYAEESSVVLHNRIFLCGRFGSDFLDRGTYEFLDPRETQTEDGDPISEWQVPLSSVQEFLAVLQATAPPVAGQR